MSERQPRPAWYHLHVYFDSQTLADAQRLRQQLLEDGLPLT